MALNVYKLVNCSWLNATIAILIGIIRLHLIFINVINALAIIHIQLRLAVELAHILVSPAMKATINKISLLNYYLKDQNS